MHPADNGSSMQIAIDIDESWIDNLLSQYRIDLPINDKISLTNMRVDLADGLLNFHADLKDKSSSVELTTRPRWDAERQYLTIEDLQLETNTQNLLLKSAGWFAQTFLNSTIDRKVEEQVNKMYLKQLEKLKEKPLDIPIPQGGTAKVMLSSIIIHELIFMTRTVHIKATVNGHLQVQLTNP